MCMRYPFPEKGKKTEEIMSLIRKAKEMNLDYTSGRVFGSMCSSPLDITREIHSMFLEANLGNPGLCRGIERFQSEIHGAIGDLINAPNNCEILTTGGGTEGNILALWQARKETGKRKVILPKSAHFSFLKACDLLDMEPVYVSMDDNYLTDLGELEDMIDDTIAVVVGIAGTTELGLIEPIRNMAGIVGDIHFHVDAAFGGLVIPFLKDLGHELPEFDFRIEGVDSITIDPHKMGLSTVPLGLFYSRRQFPVSVKSPYLSGDRQRTLRGTRASASVPAFWATINHLGKEGYRKMIARCMENTTYLVDSMAAMGMKPIVDPVMNIASFHHHRPPDVVREMGLRGWNISRTVNPSGLRFVVMPYVDKDNIDDMVNELSKVI